MNITEFFSLDGRKLLITERVKNGNRLRRIYDRSNQDKGNATAFVQTKTPVQIARELVSVDRAIKGVEPFTFINSQAGSVLLDSLLKDKPISFVPDRSSGLETSKEIYRILKEIRIGFVSDRNEDRVSELLKLSDVFEKELSDRVLCDDALCLKLGIDLLDSPDLNVGFALPWITGSSVGSLETDRFRYLEKEFISKLVEKCGLTYEPVIKYLPEDSDTQYKSHFFKAYGLFNEVSYVADKIENGDTKYGDYTIYYMHEDYVNFLRMIFQRRGIPVTFSSGIRCSTTNTVQFMLAALDFFEYDFSYNDLRPIVYNPILRNAGFDEKSKVKMNYVYQYRKASSSGIGWGRDRYFDYLNRLEASLKDSDEEARKKLEDKILFAKFMTDLVSVADNASVGELYAALLNFTLNALGEKNKEKKFIKNVLYSQRDVFNSIEDEMTLSEMCELIRNALLAMKYNEEEETDKVNAVLLSDLEVAERKNIFVIGLSAKYTTVSSAESPVLTDEMLINCLDITKGYVKLAGEVNKERREFIENTLKTGKDHTVYFGYSYFDTVELRDNSASVFFIEHLGDNSVDEQTYEIDKTGYKWDKDSYNTYIESLIKPVEDKAEKKEETKAEEEQTDTDEDTDKNEDLCISMSSTGLQDLVACPLKYYYHRVLNIPVDVMIERSAYQWLTPVTRGNLFHHFLEDYLDKRFPKCDSDVLALFDEDVFNKCYEKAVEGILIDIPYPVEEIYEIEKEEYREICKDYVLKTQEYWESEASEGRKWINLGCEAGFTTVTINDVKVDVEGEEVPFGICFNGSIDRWDCYLDNEGILHVKITDYKTGSIDKLEDKIANHTQLQHYVYAYAAYYILAENWNEIKEKFSGKTIKRVHIDSIRYEFPLETDNEGDYIEKVDSVNIAETDTEKLPVDLIMPESAPKDVIFDPVSKLPDEVFDVFKNTAVKWTNKDYDGVSDWIITYVKTKILLSSSKDWFNKKSDRDNFCQYCSYQKTCRLYME